MTIVLNKTEFEELRCLGNHLTSEVVPVKRLRDFLSKLEQKAVVGSSAQLTRKKSTGVKEVRKNDYKLKIRKAS